MKEYISKTEREHCRQVKEIFRELSENRRDFCVVDAYPFGCVVLEWFVPGRGFDRQEYFTEASELFATMSSEEFNNRYKNIQSFERKFIIDLRNIH